MKNHHGFSLIEVLVSLLLVTSTSLALLKQQWQTSQFFNQAHLRMQALNLLDNMSEQIAAGQVLINADERFQLHKAYMNHHMMLQVTWRSHALQVNTNNCCVLKRELTVA